MKMTLAILAMAICPLMLAAQTTRLAKHPYRTASAATRITAEAYFKAYMAKDWDSLAHLAGPSISFPDRTAELVGDGQEVRGHGKVLEGFRSGFSTLELDYHPERATLSGHYALFSGLLNWKVTLADGRMIETQNSPLLVVLRAENGMVVEHREYADYHGFLEKLKARATQP